MKIIKQFALPLALSGMAVTACTNNNTNNTSIDNTGRNENGKSEYVQYKNLEGDIVKVGVLDKATTSLYTAVQKYSKNGTQDITDIGGFYAEVESNIPKNETEAEDMFAEPQIAVNIGQLMVGNRHERCSKLFNKLFELFTSAKSEKGDTITVNEYTKMMDAWSSTGK